MLINGQHALGASDWQGGGEARGVGGGGGGRAGRLALPVTPESQPLP